MYRTTVLSLLFLLPILSTAIQWFMPGPEPYVLPALALKWFVFWGVGVRLLLAGFSQWLRPQNTAQLLGLQHEDALFPIRELGFANIALGVLGTVSVMVWSWRFPAAVAGVVFYGLVGINHVSAGKRGAGEKTAMWTDMVFALVLFVLAVMVWRTHK